MAAAVALVGASSVMATGTPTGCGELVWPSEYEAVSPQRTATRTAAVRRWRAPSFGAATECDMRSGLGGTVPRSSAAVALSGEVVAASMRDVRTEAGDGCCCGSSLRGVEPPSRATAGTRGLSIRPAGLSMRCVMRSLRSRLLMLSPANIGVRPVVLSARSGPSLSPLSGSVMRGNCFRGAGDGVMSTECHWGGEHGGASLMASTTVGSGRGGSAYGMRSTLVLAERGAFFLDLGVGPGVLTLSRSAATRPNGVRGMLFFWRNGVDGCWFSMVREEARGRVVCAERHSQKGRDTCGASLPRTRRSQG